MKTIEVQNEKIYEFSFSYGKIWSILKLKPN